MSPQAPTLTELGLDEDLLPLTREATGITLVAGAKSWGKSSTLAALLNEISAREAIHIITLERTVEFSYQPGKARFEHWEMGKEFENFAEGLRAASRQKPSIIMAAELADRESVESALCAAKSGRRLLAGVIAVDVWHAIYRLTDFFSDEERDLARTRLADELRWLVCQRLAPDVDGGRHALLEIMGNNQFTRKAIIKGEREHATFGDIIGANNLAGWRTFDQSCIDAYAEGRITEETALLFCARKRVVLQGIKDIQRKRRDRWGLP